MSTTTLSCKDLGNHKCDFVARGGNNEDVKREMIDHATREHPEHRYGSDWEGTLGREIDEVLESRASAPAGERLGAPRPAARDGLPERRAGDGLTPLEGEADEYVDTGGRRRP